MWIPVVVGCFVTYLVASILTHRYFHRRQRGTHWKLLRDVRRMLLVIAHPDDECLFFGPTVQGLLRYTTSGNFAAQDDNGSGSAELKKEMDEKASVVTAAPVESQRPDVHVLCLSSGDYRRRGNERKLEFLRSCRRLGVCDSHITLIEHSKLPDGPNYNWNKHLVKEIVLRHVEQLSIDTVVCFDAYGVSGHANHAAIYVALQQLYSRGQLPVDTRVFVLESVNMLRKYAGLLDVPWSCWRSTYCYINGWREMVTGVRAMAEHRSQLTWYRVLYLVFSRYILVNTLRRISPVRK